MIDLKDAIDEINHNISFDGAKMITEGECVTLLRDLEYLRSVTADIPLDRLEAICDAERDGRCYTPPVKVGDTIWHNKHYCNRNVPPKDVPCSSYPGCKSCRFKEIVATPMKLKSLETIGRILDRNEIGTVFHLSREEAEAAQKAQEGAE